ncbi:MAG TPA: lycopene cyclase domain-containing protein [Thermoanaerobaculia bacterium]|nr:lycopene cyclase domain-containing protein [Thermoanaerobaculia bacterium]
MPQEPRALPRHPEEVSQAQVEAALVVTVLGLMLALPAALTLVSVRHPGILRLDSPDPTPRGYTWSLLLFLMPFAVLGIWFHRRPDLRLQRRAFLRAVPVLTAIGFSLDFFLGSVVLAFDHWDVTIGISVRVVGGYVPLEEFVFYLSGFLTILLTYMWCDEAWLARYNDIDYTAGVARVRRLVRFHSPSLISGAVLWVAAILYKTLVARDGGFPTYFTFLLSASIVPSVGLFHSVRPYINWRGFSLTLVLVLLVSLLWEVTLAVPYHWWSYQRRAMMGLYIGAWSSLPLEAVLVWVAVTYTTVIIYEVIKIWQASGEGAASAFFAKDKPPI